MEEAFLTGNFKASGKEQSPMSKKTDDRSYKSIFSHVYMLPELIKTFVDEPWVQELDSSNFELMGTEFVDKRLIASSQDLLFKVKIEGEAKLFVVMLEFQKKPDRYMALRLLHYLCTVYLSLLRRDKKERRERKTLLKKGRLPPVFPVVLYNGKRVWTPPKEISELIDFDFSGGGEEGGEGGGKLSFLKEYIPRFRYLCIDQKRVTDEFLEEKGTMVSGLIFMERVGRDGIESEKEDLARVARCFAPHLEIEEGKRMVAWMINWYNMVLGLGKMREGEAVVAKLESIVEVRTMLEETVEKMKAKYRQEGRLEGKQEGRLEGKLEIARKLLNQGNSPQKVAELVDLPEEEVKKLLH